MTIAILVPGRPDEEEYYDQTLPTNSNNHWFPWLSQQLMVKDILTVSVEMPRPFSPRYGVWCKEFERYDITSETILVGHSCGGGFLVRWLSEHTDVMVGKVVLVAPWLNPDNNPSSDTTDFFEFNIDRSIAARCKSLSLMYSTDDFDVIIQSVNIFRQSIDNVKIIELEGKGHFCIEDLGTVEFPELLAELLS